MSIYAIGDLHLSGRPPAKPMSVFAPEWENHWEKIQKSWLAAVRKEDLVIICGDISWAMRFPDALGDLKEIAAMPGGKVLIRGNHDFWWTGLAKMNAAIGGGCFFLHNNFYAAGGLAVCGSRGWLTPNAPDFTEKDDAIYRRELIRAESSLLSAKRAGYEKPLLALHYPPLYVDGKPTGFSALCEKYQARICVYGHLHGESGVLGYQGEKDGTIYSLVAADALGFQLKLTL
ncbi:MAG: metallophosphoesterase [Acidaminococcales bacterium]|jgi:predicted phosphohydrolase|nr:metallophosphoesterase [Acidaminococcales bacterium]